MTEQPGKPGQPTQPGQPEQPAPAPRKKSLAREILEWGLTLGAAVALAMLIHAFIGQPYTVFGPSMQPTLVTGERVVLSKITYRFTEPANGDIVVVRYPVSVRNPSGRNSYIKRIVGMPGDMLEVRGGVLLRNGEQVDEPYLGETMKNDMPALTVPEGCVFVMGDNRNDSNDSRAPDVGAIPMENVVGKVHWIYWPLDRMASVYE